VTRLADLARAEPALIAIALITVIGTVVVGGIAMAMRGAGLSLRPVAWFAVFFGIILVPQAAVHVGAALGVVQKPEPWVPASTRAALAAADSAVRRDVAPLTADPAALADQPAAGGPRFRHPARVFGADVRPEAVRDARAGFGGALAAADVAQVAFLDEHATVLAARFGSADAAGAARARLLPLLGVAAGTVPDGAAVTVRRPVGDVARLAVAGPALFLWAAADDAALARRVAASAAAVRPVEQATGTIAAVARPRLVLTNGRMAVLLLVMLVAAVLWFFKGSAWAAREDPDAGAAVLSAAALRARLLATSSPDVPWTVVPGDAPDELVVTWRYADARWLDLAGAHALSRVHRLVLRLDEAARTVRVREQWSEWDASVGSGAGGGTGAGLAWRTSSGITFYEARREVTLGVSLDTLRGGPTPLGVGASFRFDLQALKAPFRRATRGAGWTWQPLVWDAPAALRWATE
jgi:hypothetical protein